MKQTNLLPFCCEENVVTPLASYPSCVCLENKSEYPMTAANMTLKLQCD